jgi:hypothetical protein
MIYSSLCGARVYEDACTSQCLPGGLSSGRHPAPYFLGDVCCFWHENAFDVRRNVERGTKVGEELALDGLGDMGGVRKKLQRFPLPETIPVVVCYVSMQR